MKVIILYVIGFYRKVISPLKRPSCRFYPTCSEYAMEAVREYGAVKGILMSVTRILRCHPFHPGGYDPVIKKEIN